jgi:hypothetical protein
MANLDAVIGSDGHRRHRAWGARSLRCPVLIVLACALALANAASTVDIAATVGFTNTFRPGHWTPLTVSVGNRGADIDGVLEVQVTGDDALRGRQLVVSHRRNLELHGNSRKSLQFIVHPEGLSHPIVIRVRSGARELARAELDLRTRFTAQRLLLVLSRNADLDYLNDGSVDGLRVLYPHPELLPGHWRGYDAVAALVVHGVSLERLSDSQFDALRKWIAQGGILAVSGAADYALLRTPRLAALLPGVPSGLARLDAPALRSALSASIELADPVHVNRIGAFRGQVRLQAGDVPLIVERAIGLGRVLYLTFDVAGNPFDRWNGMRGLLLETLRLPPAASAAAAAEPGTETPLAALIRAEGARFPPASTVFLFLALYIGLLFAGYALPVRGARRRTLAALCGWAAPVLFAPAAWVLFGPAAFSRGATAAAVALIEPLPESGYARLGLELGLYANRSGTLRLEYLGAEPVLYPHRQARREGRTTDWVLDAGPRPYVEPQDSRRYVLHALEGEDVIAFRFDATVHAEPAGPHLSVHNASGRALDALWLVLDGFAYAIGPMAAGARLERQLIAATDGVRLTSTSWPDVLDTPARDTSHASAARLMLQRRFQGAGESAFPQPGHALLIATVPGPLRPAGASAEWSHLQRAVLALRVAVDGSHAPPAGEGDDRATDAAQQREPEAQRGAAAGARR